MTATRLAAATPPSKLVRQIEVHDGVSSAHPGSCGFSKGTSVVPSLRRHDASGQRLNSPSSLSSAHLFSLRPGWKNNHGALFSPQRLRLRVAAANADAINVCVVVAWSDEYKSKRQKRKACHIKDQTRFLLLLLFFFSESFNIKAAFYLLEQQRKMSTSLLWNGCVALGRCWHSCFFYTPPTSLPPAIFWRMQNSPRSHFRHRGL